jgi:hypothetical protein
LRGDIGSLPAVLFQEIGALTLSADTAQARGTLFPIILYVNLYCGMLQKPAGGIDVALFNVPAGLLLFAHRFRGA